MVSKKPQTYKIQFKPAAERDLKKITDKVNLRRIERVVAALASDPRPTKSREIKDSKEGFRRVPAGDYRVIYLVQKQEVQIVVVRIGHRREIYRLLGF